MNFLERAKLLTDRGIPVFPVTSTGKCKAPLTKAGVKDATLSQPQIEAWSKTWSDANTGAAATPNGIFVLDIDDVELISIMLAEAGQLSLPRTLTTDTPRPGKHLYFKQTDATRAIGNDSGEGFDCRSDDYYVVGPGSIHASGKEYVVSDPSPIADAPAWLSDWLKPRCRRGKIATPSEIIPDRAKAQETADWLKRRLEAAGINVTARPKPWEGGMLIFVDCPNKAEHTIQSGPTATCILVGADGKLGYSCKHGHCVAHDWAWYKAITKLDDALVEEGFRKLGIKEEPEVITQVSIAITKEAIRFPESALYGPLGRLAREFDAPLGYAYPALLTAFCARDSIKPDQPSRMALYTALLGGVGQGKSYVMDRSVAAVDSLVEDVNLASDRGVVKAIGDRGGNPVLIHKDEFLSLMEKTKIQGSSLAQELCELWSKDTGGVADKRGKDLVNARISLLGGVPIRERSEFSIIFSASTSRGLYDRMLFGWAEPDETIGEYLPRPYYPSPLTAQPAVEVEIPIAYFQQARKWAVTYQGKPGFSHRLAELLLRVATVASSAAGETILTEASYQAAREFMTWQVLVRAEFGPGNAANIGGQIGQWIETKVQAANGKMILGSKLMVACCEVLGAAPSEVLRESRALQAQKRIFYNDDSDHYWGLAEASA